MITYRLISALALLAASVLLASCKPIGPIFVADCYWSGTAQVWRDDNRNGVQDAGEPGLPFIKVYVDDILNNYKQVSGGITDDTGTAKLLVGLPGCPAANFAVYVVTTADYAVTTPQQLTANRNTQNEVFRFGLYYLPESEPTPSPLGIVNCSHFFYFDTGYARGYAAAPDGTVWVAADADRVSRVDIKSRKTQKYSQSDGVAVPHTFAVDVDSLGNVWFATQHGASRFDGSKWKLYQKQDGLLDNRIVDVAAARDKTVWFATFAGISQFTPSTNSWTNYTNVTDLGSRGWNKLHVTASGNIWLVTSNSINLIEPPDEAGARWKWTLTINLTSTDDFPLKYIRASAVAADGSLWLVGSSGSDNALVHFNPADGKSVVYDYLSTNGAMLISSINSVAVAKNGAVWIGTSGQGLSYFIPPTGASKTGKWVHFGKGNGLAEDSAGLLYVFPNDDFLVTHAYSTSYCKIVSIK